MYQPTFSPRAMVHVAGNYQANGQFVPVQNHAYYTTSPTAVHPEYVQFNRHTPHNSRQRIVQVQTLFFHINNVFIGSWNLENSYPSIHFRTMIL